jgi:hypothetical protein
LVLDHRGHGRGLRNRHFRLEECADDVVAVGVRHFVAVGWCAKTASSARHYKLAASIPGARVFEVDDDHDACVRDRRFPETLVGACRGVVQKETS